MNFGFRWISTFILNWLSVDRHFDITDHFSSITLCDGLWGWTSLGWTRNLNKCKQMNTIKVSSDWTIERIEKVTNWKNWGFQGLDFNFIHSSFAFQKNVQFIEVRLNQYRCMKYDDDDHQPLKRKGVQKEKGVIRVLRILSAFIRCVLLLRLKTWLERTLLLHSFHSVFVMQFKKRRTK